MVCSPSRRRSLWSGAVCLVACLACSEDPSLEAARHGSLTELRSAVDRSRQHDQFDREALQRLAHAIGEREILAAIGEEGRTTISLSAPCATRFEHALGVRARQEDDIGAATQSLLLRLGRPASLEEILRWSRSPSGAWRATAALAARNPSLWALRRQAMVDLDERVRLAAFEAAILAPSPDDLHTLTEAVRTDPNPPCRHQAANALASIGGKRAARSLISAWPSADQELRITLLRAWAAPATAPYGGRAELESVTRKGPPMLAVTAASLLAQDFGLMSPEVEARIQSALNRGSQAEQKVAIRSAIWSVKSQAEELLRLGKEAVPEVRVLALRRALEVSSLQAMAISQLRQLAKNPDGAGILSRRLLARRGEESVLPELLHQNKSPRAWQRSEAALALWDLQQWRAFSVSLADDAPEVRWVATCAAVTNGAIAIP